MKKLALSAIFTIAILFFSGCRKCYESSMQAKLYYIQPVFADTLVMRAGWFADVHQNMFVRPVNYSLAFDYYMLNIPAPDSAAFRRQIVNSLATDAWDDVFVKRSWYQEEWLRQRTMSFKVHFTNGQVIFDYPLTDFGHHP